MKVLHLFSDWKWTGPAEPAVQLVEGLRREGADARLACAVPEFEALDTVEKRALQRGLSPVTRFCLRKHFSLLDNWRDARALASYIDREEIDILHAHRRQDHWVAAMAKRRARRPVKLVRTCHDASPLAREWRNRRLLSGPTDLLIDVSRRALDEDRKAFGLESGVGSGGGRAIWIPPAVDTERFDPATVERDLRAELSIPQEAVVVGIVARIQAKRRFDLLFEAFREVARKEPRSRLMLIGRGTKMQEVAVDPVRRMGLADSVIFANYRREDYREALKTLDLKVFMVPGSDGSCRAVLQALSMGVPVVSTRRGILPELIEDGVCGRLADETVESLSAAILALVQDAGRRKRMAQAARARALSHFSLPVQARRVLEEYRALGWAATPAR